MPVDSADSLHLQIESMKLAFADVWSHVADIDHMKRVTVEHLLDDAYLASRAKRIDMKRTQEHTTGLPPDAGTDDVSVAVSGDTGPSVWS